MRIGRCEGQPSRQPHNPWLEGARHMPYDHKKKKLIGYANSEVISRRYEMQVSNNRQGLVSQQTEAERLYETHVAHVLKSEYGIRYVTQKIFHASDLVAFITDFYFKNFHLAVELDGPDHVRVKERVRDSWRDDLLLTYAKVRVIRFTNEAITQNPTAVFDQTVKAMLAQENATPSYYKYLKRAYHPYD
jgi:very-short-patch-repair endonuclease